MIIASVELLKGNYTNNNSICALRIKYSNILCQSDKTNVVLIIKIDQRDLLFSTNRTTFVLFVLRILCRKKYACHTIRCTL